MSATDVPSPQALWEDAPAGLLLTRADGAILRANRTLCGWLGADEDTLRTLRFADLLTPGGRIFHQTHWLPLLQMQGSVAEVKLVLRARDGRELPAMLNALRRSHDGVELHEIAAFPMEERNAYERELMHARRRAEAALAQQVEAERARALADARLRMALDAAKLYVWSVDPRSGQRRFDPKVALLLGAPAPEPVDTARWIAAVHPDDVARALDAFARLLDGRAEIYHCRYRLRGEDGVERVVQSSASLIDEAGSAPQVIGLLQDITELSAQRAAAEDRALLAEQTVGIVSHDLRNPLAAIMMGASALQHGKLPEPYARAAHHIVQSGRRAKRLIDDLLDFTSARMGRGIAVQPRMLDLHATVAGFVDELQRAHPAHELRHHGRGEGACRVDSDRLFQALGNLVSNAVAYGAPGTPVAVHSFVAADHFGIEVHNRGLPIASGALPTLFQPLVRGADAERGSRSIGLGLYIVAEIARAHGGGVEVESTAEAGTRFAMRFPHPAP